MSGYYRTRRDARPLWPGCIGFIIGGLSVAALPTPPAAHPATAPAHPLSLTD